MFVNSYKIGFNKSIINFFIMKTKTIQFIFSIVFLLAYFIFLGVILEAELSDTENMKKSENSMMGELKILIGVLTGAVGQILNFWFNAKDVVSPQINQTPAQ